MVVVSPPTAQSPPGAPPPQSILALNLGATIGFALKSANGAIARDTVSFHPSLVGEGAVSR